jgi:hypothetical protein
MDNKRSGFSSLRIVAFLFILSGILSLLQVIAAATQGSLSINFGVLGLFIGQGLLRRRIGWRQCALAFLWIAMIGAPLIAIFFVTASSPLEFKFFGRIAGTVPMAAGIVLAAGIFALAFWQHRVLTSPAVRELFGISTT